MKFMSFALTMILANLCFTGIGTCSEQKEDNSGMYQWTDDSCTVNYSDNPLNIPKKYEKKTKKFGTLSRNQGR